MPHTLSLCYDTFLRSDIIYIFVSRIRELHSIFNEFDANQDGYISLDEARRALRNMAFNDHEIEALMATYDANQDGRLQYEEFVKMWNAQ